MTSAANVDPRAFRSVLGQFCTGITIITTMHDDAPVGFACQSFAALSLEPPLVFESLPGALRVRIPTHAVGASPAALSLPPPREVVSEVIAVATGRTSPG